MNTRDVSNEDPGTAEVISPAEAEVPSGVLRKLLARLPQGEVVGQAGWLTFSYGFSQAMRLVTNVVLAYLLAPQLFGVMLIVNTLRTGVELLSDIGITANVISNPRGAEPDFYNTAFTLQVIRGVILGVAILVLAGPLTHIYPEPELRVLIPLMSVLFVLSGLPAPSIILLIKHGSMRMVALSESAMALGSVVIHVALALLTPTVWALYLGLLLTTLLHVIVSYMLMERGKLRLCLRRDYVGQILSFGKWVFVSSMIYFLAMNFDRLYFAQAIPFAVLGVYGVARTFSDTVAQLVQRIGNMLIYPKIAASQQDGWALRGSLAPFRRTVLAGLAVMLAWAVAGSDRLILTLYDGRYHAAAFMLPILMLGVWFSILSTLGEAVMMGTGRPNHAARANTAKFLYTVVALPLAIGRYGMLAALCVIASGDAIRYASLALSERKHRTSFIRQDIALTLLLIGLALGLRVLLTLIHVAPTPAEWWALGTGLQ
jgi:O-antigen/teichoic acid export membrane protein